MSRYERPSNATVDALRVSAETKGVLKRLLQLTDRPVHISRSDTSKVRPVWTFTLASPFRDVQVAVALNTKKAAMYVKARNRRGADIRAELGELALIEDQYPNPTGRKPPSFFSTQGIAPGLQPDVSNPLLRIAPNAGRALDALNVYLGVTNPDPTLAVPHPSSTTTKAAPTTETDQSRLGESSNLKGSGTGEAADDIPPEDDESAFPEGVAAYKLHRQLERDGEFSRRVKRTRLKTLGKLECEVCHFDFVRTYGLLGLGYIEAHHRIPVHKLGGVTPTNEKDLALVCSNCHRMLHRSNPQFTVEELRSRIKIPG